MAHMDVTEQKQAKDALVESEVKFRSLFDLSPQAIALVHRDPRDEDVMTSLPAVKSRGKILLASPGGSWVIQNEAEPVYVEPGKDGKLIGFDEFTAETVLSEHLMFP